MAEDPDIEERLSKIEAAQQEQNDLLQAILERLEKLESKKSSSGGSSGSKKKAGTDKSKALKPSVAKKGTSGGGKKKGSTGDISKKKKGGSSGSSAASSGPAKKKKIPDERKISYKFGKATITCARPTEGYPTEEEQDEIPEEELSIEWVHGFAGNLEDGFKAVKSSPDGSKLIYFIACFGVVYDVESGTQQYFRKHCDDITCIALNPQNTLVATGQKDPKDKPGQGKLLPNIYVWDYTTMKPVAFLDNVCERKVLRVGWSGKTGMLYSIAGDDDQSLKCYDPETFNLKGTAKPIMEFSTYRQKMFGFIVNPASSDEVFDELIGFGERQFTRMLLTEEDGAYKFQKKTVSVTKFNPDSEKAFTDAIFLEDGRYAVCGSSGNVYIGRGDTVLSMVQCHEKSVGCLAELSDNRLVTAGHDQFVKTWKLLGEEEKVQLEEISAAQVSVDDSDFVMRPKAMARKGDSDTVFVGSKSNQIVQYCTSSAAGGDGDEKEEAGEGKATMLVDGHDGQIWGIACHPSEPLFCTGGYDNAIKIWNAPDHACVSTLEFPLAEECKKGKKIEQVAWSDDGSLIVVGTDDSYLGCVTYPELEFAGWTLIPPKSKKAQVEGIGYLRFSEDGKRLAVGHWDANLYIFDISRKKGVTLKQWPPMDCGAAVSHCRWSKDSTQVQIMTRDYQIQTFILDLKKKKGKFTPMLSDPDLVEWAGDPLIAGWDVQGLFQDGWDGTDLNDASVSPDGKLIVSGDDFGNVRLHNFPAIKPESCKCYPGHAEFVVGIEFLSAHPQVISCGGQDMCVVQWTISK